MLIPLWLKAELEGSTNKKKAYMFKNIAAQRLIVQNNTMDYANVNISC